MNSKAYFEISAKTYKRKQNSFPWNIIRYYELKKIEKILKGIKSERTLELGCGVGSLTSILLKKSHSRIDVGDFIQHMIDEIPENKKLRKNCIAIEKFNIKKDQYELIVSFGAFEFLGEGRKEILRYVSGLKKNGIMIIISPTQNFRGKIYQRFHDLDKSKVHILSCEELKADLEKINRTLSTHPILPFNTAMVIK